MKRHFHVTLPGGAALGIFMHTHTLGRGQAGAGTARRGADQAAGTEAAREAGELLFTTQSPSVVIATQPPNRETDITASRGGRAGGG